MKKTEFSTKNGSRHYIVGALVSELEPWKSKNLIASIENIDNIPPYHLAFTHFFLIEAFFTSTEWPNYRLLGNREDLGENKDVCEIGNLKLVQSADRRQRSARGCYMFSQRSTYGGTRELSNDKDLGTLNTLQLTNYEHSIARRRPRHDAESIDPNSLTDWPKLEFYISFSLSLTLPLCNDFFLLSI